MKRIICIALVILSILFLGSGYKPSEEDYKKEYLSVLESFESEDFKMTFASCSYDEDYTKIVFDFENKTNQDIALMYSLSGNYDYQNVGVTSINYNSFLINGEARQYKNQEVNDTGLYYLVKASEKGSIEISYPYNLEATPETYATEVFYTFLGFGSMGVTFVDLRPFEK